MRVMTVVPTYRPTPGLHTLVGVLVDQSPVIIADDASPVTFDVHLKRLTAIPGVTVIRHATRRGIAQGLNSGLAAARSAGADWLLTVDQDTDVPADYIDRILEFAQVACRNERIGAIGAGEILDDSGPIRFPTRESGGMRLTDELIQTGTIWCVSAIAAIGGFDESLGIDAVDAAACVRLRRAGFSLALAPNVSVQHSLGSARSVRILGRTVLATGHSPERRATMVRNRLRLIPEEMAVSPVQGLRSLRRLVVNTALAVSVEEERWAKAKGSVRGLLPQRGFSPTLRNPFSRRVG